jgi:serine/threonine-protein kinase
LDYYNQAIEKDPNYAQAYAGMALAYVLLPQYSAGSPVESTTKAKAAASKALALDDSLAEAHTALAYVLFAFDRNMPQSDREFRRAIELNPNYATAHQWFAGGTLAATARFDEANAEATRAEEIDPFSLIVISERGNVYFYARRYDEAIAQFRKDIDLDQNWYLAHMAICQAYTAKGQHQEAIAECQKAQTLNSDPYPLAYLAYAYASLGKRDEAMKALAKMNDIARQRYVSAYAFATAYAGLGEKDQAFQWLERSNADRAWEILYVKVDPLLDNLRSDPRFPELVKRVGL